MIVLKRKIHGVIVLNAVGLLVGMTHAVEAAESSTPAASPNQLTAIQAARAARMNGAGNAAQHIQPAPGDRTPPNLLLTVVEAGGTKKYGPVGAIYDFGTRNAFGMDKLEHAFILRNDNAQSVVIDRIPPTCGCTTVVVEGAKKQAFPLTVESGKDIHIHTAIDSSHLDGGPFTKNVLVYFAGQSAPSQTLALTGIMRPAVAILPEMIDFGHISSSESRVIIATISYDPRLLDGGAKPQISTSVQGIKVREIKGDNVKPGAAGPYGAMDLTGYVARNYEVEIPKRMRLGAFWGQFIVTAKPALPQPNIGGIHGEVFGDISAQPATIAFGSINPNAVAPQTLTITGTTPEAVRDLRVDAPNPLLRVTVKPVDPKAPASRTIVVSLSPKTPAGAFQSYLTARSRNGDEIGVIVNAYVLSPSELSRQAK